MASGDNTKHAPDISDLEAELQGLQEQMNTLRMELELAYDEDLEKNAAEPSERGLEVFRFWAVRAATPVRL